MKYLIVLIAVFTVAMATPNRERRSVLGLGLGHDGAVVLGGGSWGWGPGVVVSGPVVPPVAVVGPNSGPVAVVGPSAGGAIVSGPSGVVVAPSHGLVGLGLGHGGLVAGHGLW